uniref:Uncharacterized protein n=1 Tax=Acrobeloides nanus TaxID=290746 RepID=A0A914BX84_9BILA
MAYNQPYGQQQQQQPFNPGYNPNYQSAPGWTNTTYNQGYPQNPQNPNMASYNADPGYAEGGMAKENVNFTNASIRAGFIRKVFTWVTIMLAVVAVMSVLPFIHTELKSFVYQNFGLYYVSYVTFLVVYIALVCCENVRRSFPSNLICTAILTLAIGYMTMMICTRYDVVSVALCFVITAVCCGTIVIFAMQTKYDLTSMIGIAFIFSMVLMVFGLIAIMSIMFFPQLRFVYQIYAALAALLFMFYLAIDVQMIMGGRKFEISPEDHVFAAIQVFLDIIYIFWMLLSLFGSSSN